jgi:hypothetical protein
MTLCPAFCCPVNKVDVSAESEGAGNPRGACSIPPAVISIVVNTPAVNGWVEQFISVVAVIARRAANASVVESPETPIVQAVPAVLNKRVQIPLIALATHYRRI